MKIFIIGYMCSGKSTVGKRLARKLDYDLNCINDNDITNSSNDSKSMVIGIKEYNDSLYAYKAINMFYRLSNR